MHPSLLLTALSATLTTAHMQLHHPPPFNATNNPHRTTPADPYLQFPYQCCGPHDRWMYPCRGYLSLLNTPDGAPTATWEAGTNQSWSLSGIGNHWGGSCQVGFLDDEGGANSTARNGSTGSEEGGKLFRVATTYEGNCPHRYGGLEPAGQEFEFAVPSDLPPGVRVFAWIWYNREQEFNMNCAAVNITAPSGGGEEGKGAQGNPGSANASESTSTVQVTVRTTSTVFTSTTVTPGLSSSGRSGSLGTTTSSSSTTDWAQYGEGATYVSSNFFTTITETLTTSSLDSVSPMLTGPPILTSTSTSASTPTGGEISAQVIAISSDSTTFLTTTIFTSSTPAANISDAGISSPSSSVVTENKDGVFYTSITTTLYDIITTTILPHPSPSPSLTSSPSSHHPLGAAAPTGLSQEDLQIYHTKNNCTCTCPAGPFTSLNECMCFCNTPPPPPSNLTAAKVDFSGNNSDFVYSPVHEPAIQRPDDHIVETRNLNSGRKQKRNSSSISTPPKLVPFHSRPLMLIADDGNGCLTPHTTAELKYPDPGPDVVPGDGVYPLELPMGNCSAMPGWQEYHGATGEDGHM